MTDLNSQRDLFDNRSDVDAGISQEAVDVWSKFLEIVKHNISELKFNTWFKPIKAKSINNNTLLITVPSQDYYEMIISRFGDIITRALRMILGKDGQLVYEIEKDNARGDADSGEKENQITEQPPDSGEHLSRQRSVEPVSVNTQAGNDFEYRVP